MPSLAEYILTLKKSNPKTEDKVLKIYLLKSGWQIADIEKGFAEVYAAPVNVADVAIPMPVDPISPIPVAVQAAAVVPAPISTPIPAPAPIPKPAPEIELAPAVPAQMSVPSVRPAPLVPPMSFDIPTASEISKAIKHAHEIEIAAPEIEPVAVTPPVSQPVPAPFVPTPEPETLPKVVPSPVPVPVAVAEPEPVPISVPISTSIVAPTFEPIPEQVPEPAAVPVPTPEPVIEIIAETVPQPDPAAVPKHASGTDPIFDRTLRHSISSAEILKALALEDPVPETAPKPAVVPVASPMPTPVSAPTATAAPIPASSVPKPTYRPAAAPAPLLDPISAPTVQPPRPIQMPKPQAVSQPVQMRPISDISPRKKFSDIMAAASPINSAPVSPVPPAPIAPISPATFALPGDSYAAAQVSSKPVAAPAVRTKLSSGTKLVIWLLILGFLAVLGIGYMRFVHGIYVFVSEPLEKGSVLSYLVQEAEGIDTAEYTTRINFKMMPREPGVESFDSIAAALRSLRTGVPAQPLVLTSVSGPLSSSSSGAVSMPGSVNELLATFPVDGSLDMEIKGAYKKGDAGDDGMGSDGRWHVKGDYSGEGLNAKLDVESIVRGGIRYIRAVDFPEMFFDVHEIKDSWISITDADDDSVAAALPWLGDFSPDEATAKSNPDALTEMFSMIDFGILTIPTPAPESLNRQIARLVAMASEDGVISVVGEPRKIIQPSTAWYKPHRVAYEYQLQASLEQFIAFTDRANRALQNEFGGATILGFTEEKKKELRSPQFAKFFDYFVRNGYFKMIVDKGGTLIGIDASLKLVSDDRQALVSAGFSFDNINRGISIDAPNPDMTFSDAYVKISGQSKELLQLKSQVKTVEAIREAISKYQSMNGGEVPDTLNGLPLPRLAFATSSYAYKKSSKTEYLLSYQIVLPPPPPQFYELPLTLVGFDASTAASSGTDLSMQYLKFVNGKNTASEKRLSLEADASKRLDSDKDRITNGLEQYIGTNITKKDTDEDGVDDYEELQKGGNPTGPGSWVGSNK